LLTAHSMLRMVLFLFISSRAWPAAISVPIASFSGTFTSVPFIFAGQSVQTGPITASLDPTAVNLIGLDMELTTAGPLGSGFIDVTLLLSFPLLAVIGEPPPNIRIIEQGPASGTGIGDQVEATLFGGGTISQRICISGRSFF